MAGICSSIDPIAAEPLEKPPDDDPVKPANR
jgi:hypothetical protein